MEFSWLDYILGGGCLTLLATLAKVLRDVASLKAGIRTDNAKATKEEIGIQTAEIQNDQLIVNLTKSVMQEIKTQYEGIIELKDKENTTLKGSLDSLQKRFDALTKEVEIIKKSQNEQHQHYLKTITELEAKVSKRDWWLRSANRCTLMQNPMDCPVIKVIAESDERKSEKLNTRHSCEAEIVKQ